MKANLSIVLASASMLVVSMHGTQATAAVVFSVSPVVNSVDRSATFDSLTADNISLVAYAEDSLSVTVNDFTYQGFTAFFPGDSRTTAFHYGWGGNSSFVTIAGTDGAVFTAIDFLLGNGNTPSTTNVRWETYLNGFLTGSGTESGKTKGVVVGWTDAAGFDELRVAASSHSVSPGFGNDQSVAIDDLRAQLASTVPEPSTLAVWSLLGLCGIGFGWRRRRKAA